MKLISKTLHQKGLRLTEQRKRILALLTSQPKSATEILKSSGQGIDKATVYRTLDCLVKLGLAGKIQFKEKQSKYELLTDADHHHHAVCDNCGSIEDIALKESQMLEKLKQQTDFKIKSHSLEFFGLCIKCQ